MPDILFFVVVVLGVVGTVLTLTENDYKNALRVGVPFVCLMTWFFVSVYFYLQSVVVEKQTVLKYIDRDNVPTYYYYNKNADSLKKLFEFETEDKKRNLPDGQDYVYVVNFDRKFLFGIYFLVISQDTDVYLSFDKMPESYKEIYNKTKDKVEK